MKRMFKEYRNARYLLNEGVALPHDFFSPGEIDVKIARLLANEDYRRVELKERDYPERHEKRKAQYMRDGM